MKPALNYSRAARYRLLALALIISLSFCLLSGASYAQSQLTYGLQVGVGSAELYNDSYYTSVAQVGEYYVNTKTEAQGGSPLIQLGGYARYYFAKVFFVQSGADYSTSGGTVLFTTESLLPGNESPELGWQPGYDVDHLSVRHRYHQLEVPLLLGVRIAKQLRLYAGPTVGVSLHTSTRVDTSDDYELANDPVFRNLRVGLGADMQRLSLDIHLQETFPNTNDSSFEVRKPLPGSFGRPDISAGYGNVALRSVVVTIGYRLY